MMKNVVIFAGSFNPITNGHMNIIKSLVMRRDFKEIWLLPNYTSKSKPDLINFTHRKNMCQIAVDQLKESNIFKNINIKISAFSRTWSPNIIDNYLNFIKLYGINTQFYQVVGTDVFEIMKTWDDYDKIKSIMPIIVAQRKNNILISDCDTLNNDIDNISSTKVRDEIQLCGYSNLICSTVMNYIEQHNLYKKS